MKGAQRTQSGQKGQRTTPSGALPVDPDRLRRQFRELTDEDLAAYTELTRRVLAEPSPGRRSRLVRETLARGRQARDKQAAGAALTADEARDLGYLQAVTKMQGSVIK